MKKIKDDSSHLLSFYHSFYLWERMKWKKKNRNWIVKTGRITKASKNFTNAVHYRVQNTSNRSVCDNTFNYSTFHLIHSFFLFFFSGLLATQYNTVHNVSSWNPSIHLKGIYIYFVKSEGICFDKTLSRKVLVRHPQRRNVSYRLIERSFTVTKFKVWVKKSDHHRRQIETKISHKHTHTHK